MRAPSLTASTLAIALSAIAATPMLAREQIPAETREPAFSAQLPTCDSPGVLATIQSRFAHTERRYWNSDAQIIAIERVRQAAFRPHGLDIMPRRYCQARAVMSNHRRLTLRFAIIEDAGLFGYGEGVQFCLDGYDRNFTAMPGCYRLDR